MAHQLLPAGPKFPALDECAVMSASESLAALHSHTRGISPQDVVDRQRALGKNTIRAHGANPLGVLGRQLRNPVLILLVATAGIALYLGDVANSLVIGVILAMSVGLGFVIEYRAELATQALHDRVSHSTTVIREGLPIRQDVTEIVPGDIIRLALGAVVPADLRLIEVDGLVVDESVLTGESRPVTKSSRRTKPGERDNVALMGTVVTEGSATGVVVATGARTEFGQVAVALGRSQPETYFQTGMRRFSLFLLAVAGALTVTVVVVNVVLGRGIIETLLFALAIAIGMTPQLLPAVVSTGLAMGSRHLTQRGVLVKRLVSIEDLGDVDVLVTDKTGTLTQGGLTFERAVALGKADVAVLGMLAMDSDYALAAVSTAGLSALDSALWSSRNLQKLLPRQLTQLDSVPFDHSRRISTALVRMNTTKIIVSKGSAEDLLPRCSHGVTDRAREALSELYAAGKRVLAVATKPAGRQNQLTHDSEKDLTLQGFLVFSDPPKSDAAASLHALNHLGITLKIATGDSPDVTLAIARDLGLELGQPLMGVELDAMTDAQLCAIVEERHLFARVSPQHKARIIRALKRDGRAVGFMGDGVNDAVAIHEADVGISVDDATDVTKDAADVVLTQKDLGVLARGVAEGRRVFNNTIKYVLMSSSADFGNMFSAAIGSMLLPFLPLLPGQVLLQDMLYDSSQLAIPGDRVDPEQVARPSHWNLRMIRRFMLTFGPVSSIFDFATFALMMWGLHASVAEFRTGWFVESLATATLIVLVIRTRRVPFFRSKPSLGLLMTVLGIVTVGVLIPYTPLAPWLGFTPLPAAYFAALAGMVLLYLVLVEVTKRIFFRRVSRVTPTRHRGSTHRIHRRAASFSQRGRLGIPRRRALPPTSR